MGKFISIRGVAGIFLCAFAAFTAVGQDAWSVSRVHSFGNAALSANYASCGLILAKDGKLYGTANAGGPRGGGIVFRVNRDGRGYEIIHDFSSQSADEGGSGPAGNVMEASDGKLYGVTTAQGARGGGTIFRLNRDGTNFEVLHAFGREDHSDGQTPQDKLIEGADGKLYGVTQYGGSFEAGTVYRINKDGSNFQLLHEFNYESTNGYWPESALLWGSDGVLYGTLAEGEEEEDLGKIFKINPDGSGFEVIHDFKLNPRDGVHPLWGLVEGRDGALYGSTLTGGPLKDGMIFKLRKDGSHYQILHSFAQIRFSLGKPYGPLLVAPDGTLFGVTRYGGRPLDGGTVYTIGRTGEDLRVIGYLGKDTQDVVVPSGELALDDAGNFYGSTIKGGLSNDGGLFRCNRLGNHLVLHTFNSSGGDGARADSQLAIGVNGLLYGTTARGGEFGKGTVYAVNSGDSGYKILRSLHDTPVGVIADSASSNLFLTTASGLFQMKPNGAWKSLHVFHGGPKDGSMPGVPLEGSDGMLYGITQRGGRSGYGILYRINKNGSGFRVLYHNPGPVFNVYLLEGSDGALYGTTDAFPGAAGTAFKVNKDGTGFLTLHTFDPRNVGGQSPKGRLMEASDGMLYGTTDYTASPVVYRMNKDGSGFQIEHTFNVYGSITGLTEGNDGALYGMASYENGAIFRMTKSGDEFSVLAHAGDSDTEASLVKLPDGSFCGTMTTGGDMYFGQVFRVSPVSGITSLR